MNLVNFRKLVLCMIVGTGVAQNSFAQEEVVVNAQTEAGVPVMLMFEDTVSMATEFATVCSGHSHELVASKLWMVMPNGHAHGSTPTSITVSAEEGCYIVEDINFLMRGEWQIIVTFSDQDKATFFVQVN